MSAEPKEAEAGDPVELALNKYVKVWFAEAPPDPDTFCRDHPECADELKSRIEDLLVIEEELRAGSAPITKTGNVDSPLAAFVRQYQRDQEAGEVCSLEDYAARFPCDLEDLAREYLAREEGQPRPEEERRDEGSAARREGRLGPYVLEREIGRGAQGIVYLAEDTRLHRKVAMKVMRARGPGSERLLARFRREGEVASSLEHPGICTVYDTGVEEGTSYIAMRYVEGASLAQKVSHAKAAPGDSSGAPVPGRENGGDQPSSSSGPSTRREIMKVVGVIEKTARALHVAHRAGVVHRDIKPGNIMITPEGDPVITDFGLARTESVDLPTLTLSGELFGTPAYMCPEQLTRQAIKVDPRADVWSLGVTLYECLSLQRPFEAPTREGLYQAILMEDPPDIRRLNPTVPRDLKGILDTALEKNRDRRYQSALHFAEDLRRAQELQPTIAKPIGRVGRSLRWARRRPYRAALVASLLLAFSAGVYLLAKWPEYQAMRRAAVLVEAQRIRRQAEACIRHGFIDIRRHDPRDAMSAFEEALELDAHNPEAIAGIAFAYLTLDDPRAALATLDEHQGRSRAPDSLQAFRIEALERAGRTADAACLRQTLRPPGSAEELFVHAIVEILAAEAKEAHGPLGAVRLQELRNTYSRAMRLLSQAIRFSPHARLLYHGLLARVSAEAENADLAREVADALVALWPQSSHAWDWRGMALFSEENRPEQIAAFQTAIKLNPSYHGTWEGLGRATAGIRRRWDWTRSSAYASSDVGALQDAETAFRNAISINPTCAAARDFLGGVLSALGRYEEAITEFRTALDLDPNRFVSHFNIGLAFSRQNRHGEAISAYEEAIRIEPRLDEAHCNIGLSLEAQGRLAEAVERYRTALRLNPDLLQARINLSELLRKTGDGCAGAKEAEEAVHRHPNSALARRNLGNAYMGGNRLEDAIEEYREATRLDPQAAKAHYSLGLGLLHRGDFAMAVTALRTAIDLRPDYAEAHCNLGHALNNLGRFDEALPEFEEGHRLGTDRGDWRYPSSKWIADCRTNRDMAARAKEVLAGDAIRPEDIPVLPYFCSSHARHRDAAAIWKIALQPSTGHAAPSEAYFRFNAACEAALAGTGHDREGLDADVMRTWREQALNWLREDFATWTSAVHEGACSPRRLRRVLEMWLEHSCLDEVRAPEALTRLPAAEQEGWQTFWRDVKQRLHELE